MSTRAEASLDCLGLQKTRTQMPRSPLTSAPSTDAAGRFTAGREDSHSSCVAETKPETAERASSAFLTGQATPPATLPGTLSGS